MDAKSAVLFIALGIGITFIIAYMIPQSHSQQSPIIIQETFANGSTVSTRLVCNYYVFNDTTTHLANAKNCYTGAIDYSGTDSWTVIQSAQNHITAGGILAVGNGTFYLSKQLVMNRSSIELIGFNSGTAFLHGVTILKETAGKNLNGSLVMILGGHSTDGNNDQIRDLLVDCNSVNNPKAITGEGIYDQGAYNFGMQNVGVLNCRYKSVILQDSIAGYYKNIYSEASNSTGFYIFSSGSANTENNVFDTLFSDNFNQGISFDIEGNVHDNQFIGLASQNDKTIGFYMAYDGTNFPRQNIITGLTELQVTGTGTSGTTAIRFDGASYNSIIGCTVTNWGQASANTYDGVLLQNSGTVNSTHNTISGCIFTDTATNKMKYAIEEKNSGQDFNLITNNQFQGAFGTGLIHTLGSHSYTSTNIGYNPQVASTVTAGASVWTYTNTDGYAEEMVLSTVNGASAITCNTATDSALLGSTCHLSPSQVMTVTWAGIAPVFTKQPE